MELDAGKIATGVVGAVLTAAALSAWNKLAAFDEFRHEVKTRWAIEDARSEGWKRARAREAGVTKREFDATFFGAERRLRAEDAGDEGDSPPGR